MYRDCWQKKVGGIIVCACVDGCVGVQAWQRLPHAEVAGDGFVVKSLLDVVVIGVLGVRLGAQRVPLLLVHVHALEGCGRGDGGVCGGGVRDGGGGGGLGRSLGDEAGHFEWNGWWWFFWWGLRVEKRTLEVCCLVDVFGD